MVINIGLKQTPLHYNKTWIYFPDRNIHFYRVGFYSNVQPLLAPSGYSSMYVECSPLFFNNKKEALELISVVINELIQLGFIEKNEDIVTKRAIYLDNNYCLPDIETTNIIRTYLEEYGIHSIGRYGTWHWSSQHEDMQQAINLAKLLIIKDKHISFSF